MEQLKCNWVELVHDLNLKTHDTFDIFHDNDLNRSFVVPQGVADQDDDFKLSGAVDILLAKNLGRYLTSAVDHRRSPFPRRHFIKRSD